MLILVGVFDLGLTGKYIALLCGTSASVLISTWVLWQEGLLRFKFSLPMLKESLLFSIPLVPSIASSWIAGLSDRVILSWYGSLAETGIYSVGYGIGKGLSLFTESVFMVYGPMIYAMLKKDTDIARIRIERFVPYFFMFMLWVFMASSLFAEELVTVMTTGDYVSAVSVVPVILFARFLGSQYKAFVNILSYERKTLVISSGAILMAIVNLGANLIFVPLFGKMAAAWATAASVGIYTLWMIGWSQKSFYMKLDYRRMFIAGVIVGLTWGSYQVLVSLSMFTTTFLTGIGIKVLLLLSVMAAMWVSGCILPADKQRIRNRLTRI